MPVLFFFAVVLGIAAAKAALEAAALNSAWGQAADALGGELKPARVFTAPRITTPHGLVIRSSRGRGASTTFEVSDIRADVGFSKRDPWPSLGSDDRLFTGDAMFDAAVRVRGSPEDVVPLLGAQARSVVRELASQGAELKRGRLRLRRMGPPPKDAHALAAWGGLIAELAAHLSQQARKSLLLENTVTDPEPGVRAKNLALLVDKFPRSAEVAQAVQAGLDDLDAAVRVIAAAHQRGETARGVLRGVVVDARVDGETRLTAFNRLVAIFGYPADLASTLLHDADWTLQRAAVTAARDARDLSQLPRLCALTREEPAELAQAAAVALGALGDARAEPALIALLGHREERVQIAAASALGAFGSVRSVEPLLPLTRGLLHGDLHAAARDAVRRIQSRLGDADAGRLSVAEPRPEGALSVSEAEGGELSVHPGRQKI
ncbi:MAG TPA: HEAT repeat domain-containing protein [Myxococcales bacterium]|nr:HEAT repeat domain-containing protein [Myxococcales bacterium]